jgi:hypothetical protein
MIPCFPGLKSAVEKFTGEGPQSLAPFFKLGGSRTTSSFALSWISD